MMNLILMYLGFICHVKFVLFCFVFGCEFIWTELTENAFRNTRHCIIPSIVSPVRQNVPVRWRPLRPTAVANDACTSARRWPWPLVRLGGSGAARIILSNESITSSIRFISVLGLCLSIEPKTTRTENQANLFHRFLGQALNFRWTMPSRSFVCVFYFTVFFVCFVSFFFFSSVRLIGRQFFHSFVHRMITSI